MQVQRVAISALRVELISLLSTEQMWMSLYLDYLYEPPCSTCFSFNSSSRVGGYLLSELGFNSDRTCKWTYRSDA